MALITTGEAAAILGVSPGRVRQFLKAGRLLSQKRGRDHLLERDQVERFGRDGRQPRGRPSKGVPEKTLRVR